MEDKMNLNTMSCTGCHKTISWKMAQVTINRYHKVLCIDCQKVEIMATYPPKLAEYTIRNLENYTNSI